MDGQKLILDADADTSITADTDDQIDIEVGAADRVSITSALFTFSIPVTGLDLNGSEFILDADGDTSITADTDDQIDFKVAAADVFHIASTGPDLNGNKLIIDADGDSSIHASTDDQIDVEVAAADVGSFQSPITNYQSQVHFNLWNSTSPGSFSVSTNLTKNTQESIGPTGSGADNIWTSLDALPSNAKAVLLGNYLVSTSTGSGGTFTRLTLAPTGTASDSNPKWVAYADFVATAGSQTQISINEVWVPLDGSNIFSAIWNDGNTSSSTITIHLKGYST